MKNRLLLLILFYYTNLFSQNIILIDTTNIEYKKELIDLYKLRVEKQKSIFTNTIEKKKKRDEVLAFYKDVSSDFEEAIDKKYFVYNQHYSIFFDEILSKIINGNPEYLTIKDTKILLSFGATSNAYSVGNEIIVVLFPLIQNVKNEYELAFIICHEIAHNILMHSYDRMLDYAELKTSDDVKNKTKGISKHKYNKGALASGLLKEIVYNKQKHNRSLEHQADSLGFVLYKNAFKGYESEAFNSLITLDEIDMVKDSLTISDYKNFFTTEKFPIDQAWFVQLEGTSYNYDNSVKFWQIDSLKTHPESKLRADFIKKQFHLNESKKNISSNQFKLLQNSSKYNYVLGLFVIEEYGKSLYESLLLYKYEPENKFLKDLIFKNLVKLQEAQSNYKLHKYLDTANPRYYDHYNLFLNLFRQLRKSQLNSIINKYEN